MPVATKLLTCQSCGARTASDLERCRVCTRPLPRPMTASQAAFEEDLYSRRVRTSKLSMGDLHPVAVVLLLVAVVGFVNYQFLGYGPSWAHKPDVVPNGSTWRGYDGDGWSAVLPPDVGVESVNGPTGGMQRTWAGIDGHWSTVAGGGTLAPATAARASTDEVAEIVIATGPAPGDLVDSAQGLLSAALPGSSISEVHAKLRAAGDTEQLVDVTAHFDRGISQSAHGDVLARMSIVGGRFYVVATYTIGGAATDIHAKLVDGFTVESSR